MVLGTLEFCGVTRIELRADPSTTKFVVALWDPDCAVIVATPADWPVAIPVALTVAMLLLDEDHVTF